MNYKAVQFTIGRIFRLVAALFAVPLITSAVYGELSDPYLIFAYILPALVLWALSYPLTSGEPGDMTFYSREGLVTVGMSWVFITLIGAIPFMIGSHGKELYDGLNYFDWLFESASGFSTTGATVLRGAQIVGMSRGLLMWRSLTHWIGGMGILIFILAVLPQPGTGGMRMIQSEATGFSVGKLVSRTAITAKLLYIMYAALTALEFIMLVCSAGFIGGTSPFHALILSFGTAGTGGFTATAGGVGDFNGYVQTVVGVFMLLFGIGFGIYYLLLLGRVKDAVKNEELRWYLGIILGAAVIISLDLWLSESAYTSFFEAAPHAGFTTVSIITTTGFDITASSGFAGAGGWPALSSFVLISLMFIGGMAGSTSGGFKCSRLIVMLKAAYASCINAINPHAVYTVKLDGKKVDDKVISGVCNFFVLFMVLIVLATALAAIDPASAGGESAAYGAMGAVLSCISNVGPKATEIAGAAANFGGYASATKVLFSFIMLAGRLEIYPMLLLFHPKTFKR